MRPPSSSPFYRKGQNLSSDDVEILKLKQFEVKKMIARAKSSGKIHGINLRHGTGNPGTGDCAFEAIIQNNNDRNCFETKYKMNVNIYRNIWTNDMANRTVNSPYNTVGTKEWYNGWKEMAIPGTYERGIFGDLMLPGIACGIGKILLIFNTSLNSPEPIYVINPIDFNVLPDTEIPIVLAYNMFHYESMEPCSKKDIEVTIELVKSYQSGGYHFTKKDLPYLFGLDSDKTKVSSFEKNAVTNFKRETNSLQTSISKTIKDIPLEGHYAKKPKDISSSRNGASSVKNSKSIPQLEKNYNKSKHDVLTEKQLSYKLIGSEVELSLVEKDCKFECPICCTLVKNIQLHFQKNFCINKIDIEHFNTHFAIYQKNRLQRMNKERKERWKTNNPDLYKERKKTYTRAYKSKDPEEYKRKNLEAVIKSQNKKKEENPQHFRENNAKSATKLQNKKKRQDPKGFQENNVKAVKKSQNKKKEESPKTFHEDNVKAVRKSQDKKKKENLKGFQDDNVKAATKSQNKKKAKNPKKINEKNVEAVTK